MALKLWEVSSLFRRPSRLQRKRVARSLVGQVEDLEQRTLLSSFTVQGHVSWTDNAGGLHPAPLVEVQVQSFAEGIGVKTVSGTTNLVGDYSIDVNTGPGTETSEVFITAYASSPVADVKNSIGITWKITADHAFDVADGVTVPFNLVADNTSDAGRAFSVNNAFVMIAQYCGDLTGWIPSTIDVRFDDDITVSDFNPATKVIRVRNTAWDEWDPIQHEFGHYVMAQFGFQANPGGPHGALRNLWQTLGNKDDGIRLAWGEGWPTFFAIAGQTSMGAASLHIPEVGDPIYQSTDGAIVRDLEAGSKLGEDNEFSVYAILWDLWDSNADGHDHVSINDKELFTIMDTDNPKTLGQAWEALAGPRDAEQRAKLGAVFAQNGVAPDLVLPLDKVSSGIEIPTFQWKKNGAGAAHPNDDFKIQFYSDDFSRLVFEKDLGDVDHWQPTAEEWTTVNAETVPLKWVVQGRNKGAPETPGGANGVGYYWSEARTLAAPSIVFVIDDTISMGDNIAGVQSALQDYIDLVEVKVPLDEKPPMITVITFKDNVTVRVTSNDLDQIRDVVSDLIALGGGDCPEASAAALAMAANMVSAGGTILLATDASTHPGFDTNTLITQLRARAVTVNVILSGNCDPIESAGSPGGGLGMSSSIVAPDEHAADDDGDCDDSDGTCHCNIVPISATSESIVRAEASSGKSHEESLDGTDGDGDSGDYTFDPGQTPIDDYGNSKVDAAYLSVGSPLRFGSVGSDGDDYDYFSVDLVGGKTYAVTAFSYDNKWLVLSTLGSDDAPQTREAYANLFFPAEVKLTPETSGRHYLRTFALDAAQTVPYAIQVNEVPGEEPLPISSVELYSTVAAETGGTFQIHGEHYSGDTDRYIAALFNVMASTLGPAVLSANPDSVPAGQTVAVTLTARGTHWVPGNTTVKFNDPGMVVQSVQVASATTLTAIVRITGSVEPDLYDVTVETNVGDAKETALGVNVMLVTETITDPAIVGVDPGTVYQGGTDNMVIRGANLNWTTSDVTVDLGPGITVNSVHVDSPTRLTVNYTAAADASIGFRSATVTQAGQGEVAINRAFFVSEAGLEFPQIVDLSQGSGLPGTTLSLTVTGANTHFVDGVTTASLGDGINVVSVTVTSPTSATLNITIDEDAASNFRNVELQTDTETAVLLSGFLVGEVAPVVPEIVVISTDNGLPGETLSLTVTGANTHFVDGVTTASLGAGINVVSVTVTSPTSATVNIAVNADAAIGFRDVVLTTNDENAVLLSGFLVGEFVPVLPAIADISSHSAQPGEFFYLTVTGINTHFVDGVTTASLGEGIYVYSIRVNSRKSAVLSIGVDTDASAGFRNVVLQTNTETVVLPDGFRVLDGSVGDPQIVSISPNSGLPGQSLILTVTSTGTSFVDGVTTASLGPGIDVLDVTVTSATSADVSIAIDTNATLGLRGVVLQTLGETVTLVAGFRVGEGGGGDDVGGDVTVTVGKKTLTITGDDAANHLIIAIIDSRTIRVIGTDGTTINGLAGPQTFAAKSVAIVNLGNGDDSLIVDSNRANAIKKSAAINMGAGDDYLKLEHLTIKGRARLTLGAGMDDLALLDTVFSKQTTSDFNEAEDTLEQLAGTPATKITKERSTRHGKASRQGRGLGLR